MKRKYILTLLLLALSLLLASAQQSTFKRHDIDFAITTDPIDNFNTGNHDDYIGHGITEQNYRLSYSFSITKHIALGVIFTAYSETESLSSHGQYVLDDLLDRFSHYGFAMPWEYNVENLSCSYWQDLGLLKSLVNEYQRDFGGLYNYDGSENFVHNKRIAFVPFIRCYWFRKGIMMTKNSTRPFNIGMYSSFGYGLCSIISGDKCSENETKLASMIQVQLICFEVGYNNFRVFGEAGAPSCFGIKIGF